jgi:hypothetical protein
MKRLFAILAVLAIVVPLATSAFADGGFDVTADPEQFPFVGYSARELFWEPYNFDPAYPVLGEVYEYTFWLWTPPDPIFGIMEPAPNHPVDIWLWRPPTVDFGDPLDWPLDFIPEPWNAWGFWYLEDGASTLRRQTWPTYATTDDWGIYYAKFMLPRNAAETWFPCGFPCRWECTWYDPVLNQWNWHAPFDVVPVYRLPLLDDPTSIFWPWVYTLYWPGDAPPFTYNWFWPDPLYFVLWWGETVHPLTALPSEGQFDSFLAWCDAIDPDGFPGTGDEFWDCDVNGDFEDFDYMAHWEYLVMGYLWKTTDLEVAWPGDWPALCPWQLP